MDRIRYASSLECGRDARTRLDLTAGPECTRSRCTAAQKAPTRVTPDIRTAGSGLPGEALAFPVAAAIRRSATSAASPTVWLEANPRRCTGGAGKTSFYGAGMANALQAVAR